MLQTVLEWEWWLAFSPYPSSQVLSTNSSADFLCKTGENEYKDFLQSILDAELYFWT